MNTGKNFKIFGVRGSLIGDSIMALPILNWLERRWPGSYKYWQIARKCSQAAPLYYNHPLIDKLLISDGEEGMGPRDIEIAKSCDVVFNLMPQHPEGDSWPNKRSIFEETWVMAGLPLEEYKNLPPEEQRPKLVKWFSCPPMGRKTIGIWPCAGYGIQPKRSPPEGWYRKLTRGLLDRGYNVFQFGHPLDFCIARDDDTGSEKSIFISYNTLSFFEQIKISLGCDLVVGTDSGSGLVVGAYEHPQITLLTNHWPGHTTNPLAFATNNPKNTNFFAPDRADNINIESVLDKITEITKL